MIQPLGKNVLVKLDIKQQILVSDKKVKMDCGEVIAVSDEVTKVNVGDKVQVFKWAVNPIESDETLDLIEEQYVLAKIAL